MSEQGGLTGCATPQHGEKNKREAVRKEKGIKMTAKELNLAARTVFAEAATEGLDGQMAVAQTMYETAPQHYRSGWFRLWKDTRRGY